MKPFSVACMYMFFSDDSLVLDSQLGAAPWKKTTPALGISMGKFLNLCINPFSITLLNTLRILPTMLIYYCDVLVV